MFQEAEIENKVYDLVYGWGRIAGLGTQIKSGKITEITVEYNNGKFGKYDGEGKLLSYQGYHDTVHKNPTLFWGKPEFEAPKKPDKRFTCKIHGTNCSWDVLDDGVTIANASCEKLGVLIAKALNFYDEMGEGA